MKAAALPMIAIVDDDDDVRAGVDCLIRSLGYPTRLYPSAEAFLDAGGSKTHDCLISDVQMPGLSGVQLAGREAAKIPVILMTAHPDESVREQAEAAGCSCFLAKPCRGGKLIDALEKALSGFGCRRT